MKQNTLLIIVGSVAVVAYLLRDRIANFNRGTPYEGAGIVGTLGNVTNEASGGTLARFGSWLGERVTDLTDNRTLEDLTGTGDLDTGVRTPDFNPDGGGGGW